MGEVSYKQAKRVRVGERDRTLGIIDGSWPPPPPARWELSGNDALVRTIKRDTGKTPAIPIALEELILRFPSAPVHSLQRLHEHHVKLGKAENFHTFRVLRSAVQEDVEKPISRIFLMHTGLNELDRVGLYYRLSSRLIAEESTTVCIVRPFPGHLTRYPFQAFAETPLDKYLWDGSHLFRQFMRFMIETQWFLSAIVRRSSYRCPGGADLLGESDDVEASRIDKDYLAEKMHDDWMRLHTASSATEKAEIPESQPNRPEIDEAVPDPDHFVKAIESLRNVLTLEEHFPPRGGELTEAELLEPEDRGEPALHVLGYSLGGFTAQSVFMSWPFLISSCSTVLAGVALRELAPTGFTDPEEWQTVLHSLRYELDDRMMSKHLEVAENSIAGIDRELFTYFKRTFYEVFQQEYRGSIQTRYKAFRERMLFIVGGNDPVVRPESVLQSGPKGGLNLLEIGGLGHFLKDAGGDEADRHQRTFWLPEMATLIHRFADNAAHEQAVERRYTWFDDTLVKPQLSLEEWNEAFSPGETDGEGDEKAIVRQLSPKESVAIEKDGALPGELFERCLDDLLFRASTGSNGILFVLRNEIPTVLLPPHAVRETAAALYHDDLSIVRYRHGITARRTVLKKAIDKVCLVLPANSRSIMHGTDLHRAYPSQAESAGGRVAKRFPPESVWNEALDSCYELAGEPDAANSVRRFDGNAMLDVGQDEDLGKVVRHAREYSGNEDFDRIPSLPDCWVWISREHLTNVGTASIDVQRGISGLVQLAGDAGGSPQAVQEQIQNGNLRMVSVSRARYNPRFRGRLIVDGAAARKLLLHVALCLAASERIVDHDRETVFT